MADLPHLNSEMKARLRAELGRNRLLRDALSSGYLPSQDALLKARLLQELRLKRSRGLSGLWRVACVAAIFLFCGFLAAQLNGTITLQNEIAEAPIRVGPKGPVLHERHVADSLGIVHVSQTEHVLEVLPTPSLLALESSGTFVVERPRLDLFHSVEVAQAQAAFEIHSNQSIAARPVERIMDWELLKLPNVVALYGVPNGPKRLILSPQKSPANPVVPR